MCDDGDGLTDYQEIYLTMTDSLKTDTDGNGISDAQEDLDSDGLNNKAEFDYGTDPTCADTDRDSLTDYEEIYVYGTNPLIKDTDGDGLEDYDDIILGFSPLLQDTDGNGIWDSEEKLSQNLQKNFSDTEGHGVTKVEVAMDITGNIQNKVGGEGIECLYARLMAVAHVAVQTLQCRRRHAYFVLALQHQREFVKIGCC